MIRRGEHTDLVSIEGLILRQHAVSKYAGRVAVSDKALRELVTLALAHQNSPGRDQTHVSVAVRGGKIVGVVIGAFDRIYHIGRKLSANDIFLINEGGHLGDTLGLIDAYVQWASATKACIEIMLSWADTIPGASRIASVFERKGFARVGEMFELRLDRPAAEAKP